MPKICWNGLVWDYKIVLEYRIRDKIYKLYYEQNIVYFQTN
jgi:hypothetical protein